jgi:hypothetical protein
MPGIKSAQGTLNEIRNGDLMTEAAAAIHEGLAAVRSLGKPAKITIELTIAPQSKIEEGSSRKILLGRP